MTTMATETRPMRVGDRVRWHGYLASTGTTRYPEHAGAEGTVARVGGTGVGDSIIEVDGVPHDIRLGWGAGRWTLIEGAPEVDADADTRPTLAGGFRVGDQVRNRQGLLAEVIGECTEGCNQHLQVRYIESGYRRNTPVVGLTHEVAPAAEMMHGFRIGQRVTSRMYGAATVAPYPASLPEGDSLRRFVCVKLDSDRAGGAFGDGHYAVSAGDLTPLDEPDVGAATPQPGEGITVGARVRIANPAYTRPDGRGYVSETAFGQEGTVTAVSGEQDNWQVEGRHSVNGMRFHQHIHRNYLTVISGGSDESAAADTDDQVVRVGDHVEIPSYGRNGRVLDASYRGEPARYDAPGYSGGIASVLLDTGEETRFYGADLRLIRRDDSPIADIVFESVAFLGRRVHATEHDRDGVVVTKRDRADIGNRYKRSNQWVAVIFDGDTDATAVAVRYLALLPDTPISEMDDAARLRALQVMIHRVASYEAVRRDWCNEVNTALRGLGDLLPPELRSVNRTLGAHLRSNPQELFLIDSEVPVDVDSDSDDEPEQAEPRTFDLELVDLEYSTDAGYRVTDASVSVQVTVEPCDCGDTDCADYTEVSDPSEWSYSDQVGDDQIRDAIRAAGLPEPSRYAEFSYNDGDWTEQ
jgi:hypothetical protein